MHQNLSHQEGLLIAPGWVIDGSFELRARRGQSPPLAKQGAHFLTWWVTAQWVIPQNTHLEGVLIA